MKLCGDSGEMLREFNSLTGDRLKFEYKKIGKNPSACSLTVTSSHKCGLSSFIIPFIFLVISYVIANFNLYLCLLLVIFTILFVIHKSFVIKEETVQLIPTIGLQYIKKYISGYQNEKFIHWRDISDIIINEVILSQKIIPMATVIIKKLPNNMTLLPLFMDTMPAFDGLTLIYEILNYHLGKSESVS